jgi:transcriptional regulator GlxA family with amidase domain
VLAAAGLLDGQRAATHWQHAAFLTARFPTVDFDDQPIYIADGRVCTSAGVTAALDLMLSFIEQDVGSELARDVARELVTYLQRPGNQAQMSMFTAAPPTHHSLVRATLDHIETNLSADLTTASLADRVGVSERHLARLFRKELATSPARFVRRARAEAAAHLLTGTDLTVGAIAIRCGYGTVETLRQAFQRTFGVSPAHYRATQTRPAPDQDRRAAHV